MKPRDATPEQLLEQLQNGLKIDENDLDGAHIEHATLFFRVADQLVLQISLRDQAKQHLQLVEAEVDETIRARYRDDERKVTEREVEAQKVQHKDVVKAQKELSDLTLTVGHWSALKEAYIQRSYALKALSDLYIAGYFGDATTPKEREAANIRHKQNALRRDRV